MRVYRDGVDVGGGRIEVSRLSVVLGFEVRIGDALDRSPKVHMR
jgi:hypothetical protein